MSVNMENLLKNFISTSEKMDLYFLGPLEKFLLRLDKEGNRFTFVKSSPHVNLRPKDSGDNKGPSCFFM